LPEPEAPSAEILALHKQLLTLFAQYEHLSKRLSSLPVEEGSSQSTVQSAVARTAATFLAKEMIKVQVSWKIRVIRSELMKGTAQAPKASGRAQTSRAGYGCLGDDTGGAAQAGGGGRRASGRFCGHPSAAAGAGGAARVSFHRLVTGPCVS